MYRRSALAFCVNRPCFVTARDLPLAGIFVVACDRTLVCVPRHVLATHLGAFAEVTWWVSIPQTSRLSRDPSVSLSAPRRQLPPSAQGLTGKLQSETPALPRNGPPE